MSLKGTVDLVKVEIATAGQPCVHQIRCRMRLDCGEGLAARLLCPDLRRHWLTELLWK